MSIVNVSRAGGAIMASADLTNKAGLTTGSASVKVDGGVVYISINDGNPMEISLGAASTLRDVLDRALDEAA